MAMPYARPSAFSRRAVLRAAVLGGGAFATGLRWPQTVSAAAATLLDPRTLTPFADPLPIPPTIDASALSRLTIGHAQHRFHSGLGLTPTFGYGGASYLGPTIVAEPGEATQYTAVNNLTRGHVVGVDQSLHGAKASDAHTPRVSVHLHGGYTHELSDGHPEHTFTATGQGPNIANRVGNTWRYRYSNDQAPGTIWYHDHALGITRLNVYAGLAGLYLIKDGSDAEVLPTGRFDIPLVLQDKTFLTRTAGGTNPLYYPHPWEPEFFGSTPVINGKVKPHLAVERGFYRFRLLNGSSSRFYNLTTSNAIPMWHVGTDSGLTNKPRPVTHIVLGPGERAEVVLDFRRAPATVWLKDIALPDEVVSPSPGAFGKVVRFDVSSKTGGGVFAPTATLRSIPTLTTTRQRHLSLVEILDPATGMPMMSLLNNLPWHTDTIERPRAGHVEIWNIINLTADTHPIHLHLVQFQVLNRQQFDVDAYMAATGFPGSPTEGPYPTPPAAAYATRPAQPPTIFEKGWKDTVQAHPGMITRVIVPYGPNAASGLPFGMRHRGPSRGEPAPFTGEYVWHCHILDHEDHEMMLPYQVRQ